MSGSSFLKRRIDVTFTLGPVTNLIDNSTTQPTFSESGTDTVTLSGLRVQASIAKAGVFGAGGMQLRVYGMSLSLMNQLSTIGKVPVATRQNTVTLYAGDDVNGLSMAYQSNITAAWADMQAAPETALNVTSSVLYYASIAPAQPASYRGSVSVATILSTLAQQMALTFENNGVDAYLSNPYLHGTARDQAVQVIEAAGIEWNQGDNGVLAIWPRGKFRGGTVPLVSPSTGLIGYPSYTDLGVSFGTIFNPALAYGAKVELQSSLPQANKIWGIYSLRHQLESETPKGAWFSQIEAAEPGVAPFLLG